MNLDGTLKQDPVAILPNSNNKGYCRVLLDTLSLNHFKTHLLDNHISTYDRTYLWRILFDHVCLLKIRPEEFVRIVADNLVLEY